MPLIVPNLDITDFRPALIVVDYQVDFASPSGSLYVKGAETLSTGIVELLRLPFHLKIATKDDHPADHISFAPTHGKRPFDKHIIHARDVLQDTSSGVPDSIEHTLWPPHCVQNTPGAELMPELVQALKSPSTAFEIVTKGRNSRTECYSAFKNIWGHVETDLHERLQQSLITHVFLVGVAGDYCVYWTAVDAADLGYHTIVLADLIKNVDVTNQKFTAGNTEAAGIELGSVASLKAMFSAYESMKR